MDRRVTQNRQICGAASEQATRQEIVRGQAMNRRAMNRQLVYIVILAALSFGGWLYLRWDFIVAVMQAS
jgi:hypothetical protein